MKIPAHLKHKPIIQVENYDRIDGPYADDTDAMGLSVGIAQWNGPGWTELSAKVWRNTGEKWSRQSEELPLHRVINLATLICITMDYSKNGRLSSSDDFPVTRSAENKDNLDESLTRLSLELKRLGF